MGAIAIVYKLKNSAAVTSYVGQRIYPAPIPEGAAFPCISYQLISEVGDHAMDNALNFRRANFQIDIYSESSSELYSISDAAISALDAVGGIIEGISVNAILFQNRFEGFEDEIDVRRMIMSFDVIYSA